MLKHGHQHLLVLCLISSWASLLCLWCSFKWFNLSFLCSIADESDDEFLPMKAHSSTLSESVISSATSLDTSVSSSISGVASSCSGKDAMQKQAGSPHRHSVSSNRHKRKHKGNTDILRCFIKMVHESLHYHSSLMFRWRTIW